MKYTNNGVEKLKIAYIGGVPEAGHGILCLMSLG